MNEALLELLRLGKAEARDALVKAGMSKSMMYQVARFNYAHKVGPRAQSQIEKALKLRRADLGILTAAE